MKKFITYPRTGSMALEESLVDRAKNVLEKNKNRSSLRRRN